MSSPLVKRQNIIFNLLIYLIDIISILAVIDTGIKIRIFSVIGL